jgi:hypothetical protein
MHGRLRGIIRKHTSRGARGSQVNALRVVVLAVHPIGHARGQASGEVVVPQIEVGVGGQRAVGRRDRAWE